MIGGPINTRSTPLNCILQDLFRDTPLDHIWSAQICIFGKITLRLKSEKIFFGNSLMFILAYGIDQIIWGKIYPEYLQKSSPGH